MLPGPLLILADQPGLPGQLLIPGSPGSPFPLIHAGLDRSMGGRQVRRTACSATVAPRTP